MSDFYRILHKRALTRMTSPSMWAIGDWLAVVGLVLWFVIALLMF